MGKEEKEEKIRAMREMREDTDERWRLLSLKLLYLLINPSVKLL